MSGSILVVDDEAQVRDLVGSTLQHAGYAVEAVEDGESAVDRLADAATPPDLIVLDVRLPGIDGWEVCRRVRERADVPILFLTGLNDDANAVRGFRLGADDYLGKPFSPQVLRERVAAILRRADRSGRSPTVAFGDIVVDLDGAEVRRSGEPVHLTASEYRILVVLAQEANRVVGARDLIERAQGYEATAAEAAQIAKAHVWHLRQKLEPDPRQPRHIVSVRGLGYVLRLDEPPP
jgi:DNA-binding response OmpR family regulator